MSDPAGATVKDVLEHSWAWFELHATQRMQLLNYFFVSVAFLSGAYAAGLTARRPEVSAAVGVFGIVMSLCFNRVELRTRELVKLAEDALGEVESRLAEQTGIQQIRLVQLAERPKRRITSYGVVIRFLHYSTLIAFTIGVLYALALTAAPGPRAQLTQTATPGVSSLLPTE